MPTVLLTGFAPFGGETSNPSWEAVAQLQGARITGHTIQTYLLPVEFGASLKALRKTMREHKPALVLCVGQAGGRSRLSLERVAINLMDARIADNAGNAPIDAAIAADGPAAYFSTLPIKTMLRELHKAGIPAEISLTAGAYVCNEVFYGLMHMLRNKPRVRGGFVHIPFSNAQAVHHPNAPSMSIEQMVEGLRIAIKTALKTHTDHGPASAGTH